MSSRELIVWAADKDAQELLSSLLKRSPALGIKPLPEEAVKINVDAMHDANCYRHGVRALRPYRDSYKHALLVFDYEGCGAEGRKTVAEIEEELSVALAEDWGWGRAEVIVLYPELESWIWSRSHRLPDVFGWELSYREFVDLLGTGGFPFHDQVKPTRPKEAMEYVLKKTRLPWSASLFANIGAKVSFSGCRDPGFLKLQACLRRWFPGDGG